VEKYFEIHIMENRLLQSKTRKFKDIPGFLFFQFATNVMFFNLRKTEISLGLHLARRSGIACKDCNSIFHHQKKLW